MIKVHNMSLKYPSSKNDTIKDICFEVKKGEIFGFLGPSGAGKSTIQKILTGVLRYYRGTVNVLGCEIKDRSSSFYENIGVDFEFPNFYNKFTALENLKYFASLYSKKITNLSDLLVKVGLKEDEDKKVESFSKGMKMRLGFIRSIMHDPELLFLDEPTSGLDPGNSRILKDMILELKNKGKTIILTTHNMQDAEELCDHVAFIVDGKIKALDTPHALRKSNINTNVSFSYIKDNNVVKSTCLLSELSISKEFSFALNAKALKSIHSEEQTLEDVFISLTGRCL